MEILHINDIISTLLYSTIGVVIFFIVLGVIEMGTKYSINKKIAQDGNIALAIVLGSIILSLGMIISSAIH